MSYNTFIKIHTQTQFKQSKVSQHSGTTTAPFSSFYSLYLAYILATSAHFLCWPILQICLFVVTYYYTVKCFGVACKVLGLSFIMFFSCFLSAVLFIKCSSLFPYVIKSILLFSLIKSIVFPESTFKFLFVIL